MASGQKVEVQVGNGFSSVRTVVEDDSKSVFSVSFLAGDLANLEHEVSEDVPIVGFRERDPCDGLFWDQEKVDRGLR